MWLHRANYNARHLGASDMRFSPKWAVGWWFVPIWNLWKPYQVVKEIWKTSVSPKNWKSQEVPLLLPRWWFIWIVSSALSRATTRRILDAWRTDDLNRKISADWLHLSSELADIALYAIVIIIIKKIYTLQMARYNESLVKAPPETNPEAKINTTPEDLTIP